jgi:branched-chain amino acid transport system substrate-binding protein
MTMKGKAQLKWLALAMVLPTLFLVLASATIAAEKKEIIIGAPLSLTGMFAMTGQEQRWAYEQAFAEVNKKGGILIKETGKKMPLKLVVTDDESEPAKVAAAMEKLIKMDKVDLMLSTHSGPLNVAGATVAEKYQKFYMITTCWPFLWEPQKFKWSALFFFDAGGGAEVPFKIWATLPEKDRPKKPALVMEDSLDGKGFGDGFKAHAKKYGYTFAVDEPWAIGAKDYSAQILKMKAAKVDAMLLFGSPSDSVTLVRQMKENGLNVNYLHGWKGTWASEFYDALGKDANYIICDGFWSEDYPYPGVKELAKKYNEKYKKHSVSIGAFYANAQILFAAIERAGSYDSAKVRDKVFNGTFKGTVMGDLVFKPNGLALFESTASQWWDAKQMLVYPFGKGTWKLKMMPPWGQR